MTKHFFLFGLISSFSLTAFCQKTTLNITNEIVTVSSYIDKEVSINGKSELHITSSVKSLNNSIIKLNSDNSWVFFDNIKPSMVIDSLLKYIYVNNQTAILKTNVRVSIYKHGAVIIPHSSSFQPMTVYTGQNFTGDSTSYSLFVYNNSLGAFDNKIRSFKLKRGYMATLAIKSDGTNYSRVYIADTEDLEIPVMTNLLDKTVSFIRVFNWEWVTKKGWAGWTESDMEKMNVTWFYTWGVGSLSPYNSEFVPERHNIYWPSFGEINAVNNSTHLLGLNEPDHSEQANALIADAVAEAPRMLTSGLRVGSPATTNFNWLYDYMDKCKANNYRIDFVVIHAYWGGATPQQWYNSLKAVHERTGRPLWIKEWNNGANWTSEWWPTDVAGQQQKQLNDLKGILQVMDTASFVERYSIFNWVEDKRAMILPDGSITPAGAYYRDNKSVMAFNKKKEVLPIFQFQKPSLAIAFTTTKIRLLLTDSNVEYFMGFVLEKKIDDGTYTEFYRSENSTTKSYIDTLDFAAYSKVRYRLRSILMDGTLTNYSNEVGYDLTKGNEIQYGILPVTNVGWNPILFNKPYTTPIIILGSPTNVNSSVSFSARAKLISASSRFELQLAPWTYQNVSTLLNKESVPYLITEKGDYDYGGLKAKSFRATVNPVWTYVNFTTAFDEVPVVFATQLLPSIIDATTVRVRNITKTGFEARLQKESKITINPTPETVSFFAITQGRGVMDNKKIIVGKTPDNTISTINYTTINYGDSIEKPIFIAQMQTCNDDTVTATMRCLIVSNKFANVFKQREKSLGITSAATESAGWMIIDPENDVIQGMNYSYNNELRFFPNPVKDFIYLRKGISENFELEVFNMVGILVKRKFVRENVIDVIDLLPGCYILKTKNHNLTKFIKI